MAITMIPVNTNIMREREREQTPCHKLGKWWKNFCLSHATLSSGLQYFCAC